MYRKRQNFCYDVYNYEDDLCRLKLAIRVAVWSSVAGTECEN